MTKIRCLIPELTEGANQDAGINRYLCGLTLQPSEETGCGKITQQLQQQVALSLVACSGNIQTQVLHRIEGENLAIVSDIIRVVSNQ